MTLIRSIIVVAITSPVHPFTVADDKYIVVMGNCQQPCLSIGRVVRSVFATGQWTEIITC